MQMADTGTNYVDPQTGTIVYNGPSVIVKGDHTGMPSRTGAYLPNDERGHLQASSLSGSNAKDNVVPQDKDLNHGAYAEMEKGERTALNSGNSVWSEKIAYVGTEPGNRPTTFMVNDTITYTDGQTQTVHLSFANLSNAEQEGLNQELDAHSEMLEAPNPGDRLRDSMTEMEYTELMEETEEGMLNIDELYDEFISVDYSEKTEMDMETGMEAGTDAGAKADALDAGLEAGVENAGGLGASDEGGLGTADDSGLGTSDEGGLGASDDGGLGDDDGGIGGDDDGGGLGDDD